MLPDTRLAFVALEQVDCTRVLAALVGTERSNGNRVSADRDRSAITEQVTGCEVIGYKLGGLGPQVDILKAIKDVGSAGVLSEAAVTGCSDDDGAAADGDGDTEVRTLAEIARYQLGRLCPTIRAGQIAVEHVRGSGVESGGVVSHGADGDVVAVDRDGVAEPAAGLRIGADESRGGRPVSALFAFEDIGGSRAKAERGITGSANYERGAADRDRESKQIIGGRVRRRELRDERPSGRANSFVALKDVNRAGRANDDRISANRDRESKALTGTHAGSNQRCQTSPADQAGAGS